MKADKSTLDESGKPGLLVQWAGALLLAAGLFALAALVAFGSFGRKSEWGWGFAILGFVCLIGWFLGRRGAARVERIAGDQYSKQRTLLGVNSVVSVLLLLLLLVGVNYIATRRHKTFDLTKSRINSLSPQTQKALDDLKQPINLIYLWAPSEQSPQVDPGVRSILEAYANTSDKVSVEYFNAAQDPMRVQTMQLHTFSGQPMLLVEKQSNDKAANSTAAAASSASDRQEVAVVDEQNITSAIMKLGDAKPRVLYFLTGHGELSPLQQGAGMGGGGALNGARAALEAQNYTLKALTLISPKSQIPADAEAVVVIAPQVDLSPAEVGKLRSYINGKGRLVLLFQTPRAPLNRWKSLLSSINVEMLDGQVMEFDQERAVSPQVPIGVLETERHSLLRGVSGAVVFPGVIPLKTKPAPPQAAAAAPIVTPIFETSVQSEVLRVQGGQVARGGTGPFVIAAAVEKSTPGAMPGAAPSTTGLRAVVVGNAAFCTDTAFNQFGNTSFFLSAINWVAGNDALVSIPPKEPVTNTINMSAGVQRFAVLFSLFTLPVLLLLAGTVVWWKRR